LHRTQLATSIALRGPVPLAGKSTVAQQLAARVNIPNVMQTDVLCDLLRAGEGSQLSKQPLWARTDLGDGGGGGGGSSGCGGSGSNSAGGGGGGAGPGDAALLGEFRRECRVVRQAMQGDLVKVRGRGGGCGATGQHARWLHRASPAARPAPRGSSRRWVVREAGGRTQGRRVALASDPQRAAASHLAATRLCALARCAPSAPRIITPQTISDGKPIIIEGLHLDPALFIPEFARTGVIMLPARAAPPAKGGSPPGARPAAGFATAAAPGGGAEAAGGEGDGKRHVR
jgi:hypothetical protein